MTISDAINYEVGKAKNIQENLSSARQALKSKDWTGARFFYSLVRENDRDNIEALVYDSYCRAMESLSVNETYERQSIFETLKNILILFCINYIVDDDHEYLLKRLNNDIIELTDSPFVYTSHKTNGVETSDDSKETIALFCDILVTYALYSVDHVAKKYYEKDPQTVNYIRESANVLYKAFMKLLV